MSFRRYVKNLCEEKKRSSGFSVPKSRPMVQGVILFRLLTVETGIIMMRFHEGSDSME